MAKRNKKKKKEGFGRNIAFLSQVLHLILYQKIKIGRKLTVKISYFPLPKWGVSNIVQTLICSKYLFHTPLLYYFYVVLFLHKNKYKY